MSDVTRRELLGAAALTAAAATLPMSATAAPPSTGRVKQSVCRWPFNKIPLPEFFKACAEMGLPAVDLLTEEEWIIAKRDFGLDLLDWLPGSSLDSRRHQQHEVPRRHRGVADGDDPESGQGRHPERDHVLRQPTGAGPRGGQGQQRGLPQSHQAGRRGRGRHRDRRAAQQQGQSQGLHRRQHRRTASTSASAWLAAHQAALRHLPHADHGGGRPPDHGRQLGVHRPLCTPAASRAATSSTRRRNCSGGPSPSAVADTGYQGYFAHEFIPKRDPLTSLREAVTLCTV